MLAFQYHNHEEFLLFHFSLLDYYKYGEFYLSWQKDFQEEPDRVLELDLLNNL